MHRTEADGSVSNLYVDENLPTYEGTLVTAADRNAVQEELCNVIEGCGYTVQTEGTDTHDQLFDAITNANTPMKVLATPGASYAIEVTNTGKGISFGGTLPGGGTFDDLCMAVTSGAGLSWSGTAPNYYSGTNMTFIGVPHVAEVYSTFFIFKYDNGAGVLDTYVCPAVISHARSSGSGSNKTIEDIMIMSTRDPASVNASDHLLVILYSATDVD